MSRRFLALGLFLVFSMETSWSADWTCVTCEPLASRLGESRHARVSRDGSILVFQSTAKLVKEDVDKNSDIYVWRKSSGKIERLKLQEPGRRNGGPSISAEGKYVVFHSYSPKSRDPNMVTPSQIILWNLETRERSVITKTPQGSFHDGEALLPQIVNEEGLVLFSSNDSNLIPGKPAGVRSIYLHNRTDGTLTVLSRNADGAWANRMAWDPRISEDGRYVAFRSDATNLCGDLPRTSLSQHLYLKDRWTAELLRIDEKERGYDPEAGAVGTLDMDDRGHAVVFESYDRSIKDPYKYLRAVNLFIFTQADGRVRPLLPEPYHGPSRSPAMSGDGRYVVFISRPEKGENGSVMVFDRQTNALRRTGLDLCEHPTISQDGTTLAFECHHITSGTKKIRHIYHMRNPFYGGH